MVWFLLGCFFFALFPWIAVWEKESHRRQEPFFSAPIPAASGVLVLRNDAYGEGYFGASRGSSSKRHEGIDLVSEVGMPVLAAKSGRVVFVGPGKGYGKHLDILHPDGHLTRYAHLSSLEVQEGKWVPQGTLIGKTGKSGNASRHKIKPHLHFEIRNSHGPQNPLAGYLDPSLNVR